MCIRDRQGGGPTPNLVVVLMTGFNPSSNPGLAILNAKLQTAFGSLPGFASQVFTFGNLSDLYLKALGKGVAAERAFVADRLRPALVEIATAYRDGTELGLCADADLLLAAGSPELNATWMDANASDGPVTPRHGYAVEMNALWIALLDFVAELERTYGDGCDERDRAYHQGTVWPWLLGAYTEARLRAYGASEAAPLREIWDGMDRELRRAGLGHLSEVFDGDAPHTPGGTIAQAWNTAECLRAYWLIDEFEAGSR